MKVMVRIPRKLFELATKDLMQLNELGGERVGFFSTTFSKTKDGFLVHCVNYRSVDNDGYTNSGTSINIKTITNAMSRTVKESQGQIHVHYHGGVSPSPSSVDSADLPRLTKSLANANPSQAHGWVILGGESAWAAIFPPHGKQEIRNTQVSLIGFPIVLNKKIHRRTLCSRIKQNRYSRQSFLGKKSAEIMENCKIGVIGLCGGGSHVVQQLAHVGFKNFVLCDFQRVDYSNLNRLVGGTIFDVLLNRRKVKIAERIIRNLHVNASVIAYPGQWEEFRDDLKTCDLIIGCVDKFSTRRDLEEFSRRHLIPYLDVGMDVRLKKSKRYEIYGQVALSMPGEVCFKCMQILTDDVLAKEAENYGDAGGNPQVVWSNGILCSALVGVVVDLFTDWSKELRQSILLSYRGSLFSLIPDNRSRLFNQCKCSHFSFDATGDPIFKKL